MCVWGEVRLSRTNSQKIGTQAKVFGQKARSKSRPEPEQDPRGPGARRRLNVCQSATRHGDVLGDQTVTHSRSRLISRCFKPSRLARPPNNGTGNATCWELVLSLGARLPSSLPIPSTASSCPRVSLLLLRRRPLPRASPPPTSPWSSHHV